MTSRRPRAGRPRAAATFALAALALLPAPQARAWNATGHMAVAGIAYDNLTPKAKASVDALLLRHKDYGRWMADLPGGATASKADCARYAFERAATWPDDVRKTPDDRPIWHYVDVPVVAPGYAPDPIALLPVLPNAETQTTAEAALLGDAKTTDGDRAAALCWVEHLVGDIHQPLHDASLFSAQFPKGDKGGNSDLLAQNAVDGDPVESMAHPHNLHALWDDMLGNSREPQDIQKIVARLEGPAFARRTYPQIAKGSTVHEWVTEGNVLARDVAYAGGSLPMRPYGEKADVLLPPGYLGAAHAVADRQVALAGLRLADTLGAIFDAPAEPPPVPAAAEEGRAATKKEAAATKPGPMKAGPMKAGPMKAGPIVGNRSTRLYHVGDNGHLPPLAGRVYFPTEAAAKKAGYRRSAAQ